MKGGVRGMWQNFLFVFSVCYKLVIEFAVMSAIAVILTKLYERIVEPAIKKHEPAVRERVHEVAKAINW